MFLFTCPCSMQESCKQTINKYGVGSCGPRGFYGTIDVHLQLEVSRQRDYDTGAPGEVPDSVPGKACTATLRVPTI